MVQLLGGIAKPVARCEDGRIVLDHGEHSEVFPNLEDMRADPSYGTGEVAWVYIYALAEPGNGRVRYIGKSIRPLERLSNHRNDKSTCHRTNWIRLLASRGHNPVMGILDRLHPSQNWQAAERAWIKYGREAGWDLINETDGGDGVLNLSPEAKQKLSARFKGKPLSPEHAKKCGHPGRKASPETKAKMSKAHKGRVFTLEWRQKISDALRGRPRKGRKITPDQAAEIKREVEVGGDRKEIAKRHGISTRTIWLITSGRWCRNAKEDSNHASE
jgi:hypothetical protein